MICKVVVHELKVNAREILTRATHVKDEDLGGIVGQVGKSRRDGHGAWPVESVPAMTGKDDATHHLRRELVESLWGGEESQHSKDRLKVRECALGTN